MYNDIVLDVKKIQSTEGDLKNEEFEAKKKVVGIIGGREMKKLLCAFLCCFLTSLFGCSNTPTEQRSSNLEAQSTSATSSITDTAEVSSTISSDITTTSLTSSKTTSAVSKVPTTSTAKPEPNPPQQQEPEYPPYEEPTYEPPQDEPQEPIVNTITLPDMTGENGDTAKSSLLSGDIQSVKIVEEYSDTVEEGKVIRQTPAGGTKIKENELKNTVVTLYVSKGKEIIYPTLPQCPITLACGVTITKIELVETSDYFFNYKIILSNDNLYTINRFWMDVNIYNADGIIVDSTFLSSHAKVPTGGLFQTDIGVYGVLRENNPTKIEFITDSAHIYK